jgi:hypothetical protein
MLLYVKSPFFIEGEERVRSGVMSCMESWNGSFKLNQLVSLPYSLTFSYCSLSSSSALPLPEEPQEESLRPYTGQGNLTLFYRRVNIM